MINQALSSAPLDDRKAPLPKDIKSTKASTLKREHTQTKIASILAKKMGLQYLKPAALSHSKHRRCASEIRNRDIEVISDKEPVNIKLNTATITPSTRHHAATKADTNSNDEKFRNILTARRATSYILRSLDSLIHD